jgi:hypothetical protein
MNRDIIENSIYSVLLATIRRPYLIYQEFKADRRKIAKLFIITCAFLSTGRSLFWNKEGKKNLVYSTFTVRVHIVRHAGIQEFPNLNLRSKGGTYK